ASLSQKRADSRIKLDEMMPSLKIADVLDISAIITVQMRISCKYTSSDPWQNQFQDLSTVEILFEAYKRTQLFGIPGSSR
ncbi:hypothetical protein diail_7599, partial [Diaporthe ilicicola]